MPADKHFTVKIPIKDRQGRIVDYKEVIKYAGLLAKAHEEGLSSISTELVQTPSDGNGFTAIIRAQVTTSKGTFSALGDSNPDNVNPMIRPHMLRMAETRAKARALRDAVNVGMLSLEELGSEVDEADTAQQPAPPAERPVSSLRAAPAAANRDRGPAPPKSVGTEAVSATQVAPDPTLMSGASADRHPVEVGISPDQASTFQAHTDSQRKYLFRLLAGRDILGEDARQFLLDHFNVDHLKFVSSRSAHSMPSCFMKRQSVVRPRPRRLAALSRLP